VSAALGMRQAMVAFNRSQTERGLPAVGMGIGLNTGPMFVGDMGSDVRRSYTVIGDAVNLGSRLEGLSKLYGVDVVVSDSTRQQAGEGFIWQELDKVKVKGKQEAVTIHTVLGPSADQTPALDAELELWQRCLQLYRQQEWAQTLDLLNNLQKCAPDKGLYPLYQQRVLDMQTRPPVPNWDGSTQFDTK
jgi:adenylate cyclase